MAEEQELLLDPALFEAVRARMPRLGRVEVQVKRGEYDNEVSRFRYDVVLHLDADLADVAQFETGSQSRREEIRIAHAYCYDVAKFNLHEHYTGISG